MKKLTFILFVVILASCNGKKVELVELIKAYKDSVTLVQRDILDLTIDETKVYKKMFSTNGEFDLDKVGSPKIQKEYQSYETGIKSKKWGLELKKIKFKNKIDSLELELKKY